MLCCESSRTYVAVFVCSYKVLPFLCVVLLCRGLEDAHNAWELETIFVCFAKAEASKGACLQALHWRDVVCVKVEEGNCVCHVQAQAWQTIGSILQLIEELGDLVEANKLSMLLYLSPYPLKGKFQNHNVMGFANFSILFS